MVKIGGYDDFCIKDESEFKLLETMYSDKWELQANWGHVGTEQSNVLFSTNKHTPKHIIIEPQLPYIYVSQNDYKNWVQIVNAQFAGTQDLSFNCLDT